MATWGADCETARIVAVGTTEDAAVRELESFLALDYGSPVPLEWLPLPPWNEYSRPTGKIVRYGEAYGAFTAIVSEHEVLP